MNKHLRYLELAKNISTLSNYRAHHIGAILVYRRQVISEGYNMSKTHPLQAYYNQFRELRGNTIIHKAHAEIICLSKVKYFNVPFEDCTLYIYREWKTGEYAMARPCKACFRAIKDFGIGTMVYTTYGKFAIEYL